MSYLCDDFLNKHKRLIIEEFEAGFAYTYSGEPNFLFTLVFDVSSALHASCSGEEICNTRDVEIT